MHDDERWEKLFADLSTRATDEGDLSELVEAERVSVTLQDRLRAATGETLAVRSGGVDIVGTLADVGLDWVRIRRADGDILVPLSAITWLSALGSRRPAGGIQRSLNSLLRAIARASAVVVCAAGGEEIAGRIIAVAADHLEVRTDTGDVVLPTAALNYVRAPKAAFA